MARRDPEARAELAKLARVMYEDGETLVEIAAALEVSYGKAHALVKEAGGTMRRRGGPAGKKETPYLESEAGSPELTDEQADYLRRLALPDAKVIAKDHQS